MWCMRKSLTEYSPVPHSNSSSSFSSKILSKLSGMIPFNPLRKLSTSSRTLLHNRCWARASKYWNSEQKENEKICGHFYDIQLAFEFSRFTWCLVSFVTRIFDPFGTNSIVLTNCPALSNMSSTKYNSMFSLVSKSVSRMYLIFDKYNSGSSCSKYL